MRAPSTRALIVTIASLLLPGCGGEPAGSPGSSSSHETTGSGGSSGSTGSGGSGPLSPAVGDIEDFADLPGNSEGLAFGKGPDGSPVLYVGSDDRVVRVHPDGSVDDLADVRNPVGMAIRADGSLIVCGSGDPGMAAGSTVLWKITPSGERSLLVGPDQFSYAQTNFVAVAPDDSIAFSDSGGDKLYRADQDGGNVALIADPLSFANGLSFSADGQTLFVASWDTAHVLAVPRHADGTYGAPEAFLDDAPNVDGLAVFASGDLLLVASGEGLVRVGPDKAKVTLAPGPALGLPANAAFGTGEFGEGWVYVTNLLGTKLRRVYAGEGGAPLPVR